MPFITIAGEQLIAQRQGAAQVLSISHFVLANIAGLGAEPANRIEAMPAPGNIVHTQAVSKSGYVNANQVVYSLAMDSTVGDFTFNWVGLKASTGELVAVAYIPPQQKIANNGSTPGNNLTRNFLLAFSGAQQTTAIAVPAETWQIDFTTRLLQIDERERLSNFDIYDQFSRLEGGFVVSHVSGSNYSIAAGVAYVGGIRCQLNAPQALSVTGLPKSVWVDASLQGDINGVDAVFSFSATASTLTDYTDGLGFKHFVAKIADILADGSVADAVSAPGLLPFSAMPPPTVDTVDHRLTVTPLSAAAGGTVSIAPNVWVALGEAITATLGRMNSVKTPAFTSADLLTNALYFLRGKVVDGRLRVYLQRGARTDATPAGLVGTENAASGGGFDSTPLDVLLAEIQTGAAGTVPQVTPLANAARLVAKFTAASNPTPWTFGTFSHVIDWGRKPLLAGLSETGDFDSQGATMDCKQKVTVNDRYSISVFTQAFDGSTSTTTGYSLGGTGYYFKAGYTAEVMA